MSLDSPRKIAPEKREKNEKEQILDNIERELDQVEKYGGEATFAQVIRTILNAKKYKKETLDEVAGWLARHMYIGPHSDDPVSQLRFNEQVEIGIANSLVKASQAAEQQRHTLLLKILGLLKEVALVAYNIDLVSYPDALTRRAPGASEDRKRRAYETVRREHCLRMIEQGMVKALNWGLDEDSHETIASTLKTHQKEYEEIFRIHRSFPVLSPREKKLHKDANTYPLDPETAKAIMQHHKRVKIKNLESIHGEFWEKHSIKMDHLDRMTPPRMWETFSPFLVPDKSEDDDTVYLEAEEILAKAWDAQPRAWEVFIREYLLTSHTSDFNAKSAFLEKLFRTWNGAQKYETGWSMNYSRLQLEDKHWGVVFRRSRGLRDILQEFIKEEKNYWVQLQAKNFLDSVLRHLGEGEKELYEYRDRREDFNAVPWFKVDPLRYGMWSRSGQLLLSAPRKEVKVAFEESAQKFLAETEKEDELGFVSREYSDAKGRTIFDVAHEYCKYPLMPSDTAIGNRESSLTTDDVRSIEILYGNEGDIIEAFGDLHLRERPLIEQVYFLRYLRPLGVHDVRETQRFLRAYGMNGFRAFMASYDDLAFANEVVWTGNLLLEGVMVDGDPLFKEILQAYVRVLDSVDIARDVYRERMGREMTDEEYDRVGVALRERATLILKRVVRSILGDTKKNTEGDEEVQISKIKQQLENIEAEVVVLTSAFRALRIDPRAVKGGQLVEIPSTSLKGELKRQAEIVRIQEQQYQNKPPEFVGIVKGALRRAMESTGTRFFMYQLETGASKTSEVAGLFRLDDIIENGKVVKRHFASMILNPKFEGGGIMERIARDALTKEVEQVPIEAECFPMGARITEKYHEWGFVATGMTKDLGMDLLKIEWDPARNEKLDTVAAKLPRERIVDRADKSAVDPSGRIRYYVGSEVPRFEDYFSDGYMMTRFFSQQDKKVGHSRYYAVFEKPKN